MHHPRWLAAIWHVLRRRFLVGLPKGREPRAGYGQRGFHSDWYAPETDRSQVATMILLLDDFEPGNGATRVVPGSHRTILGASAGSGGARRVSDPAFVHPRQQVIVAPAGAALVFNGHLWHSATRNASGARRRTLQLSAWGFEHIRIRTEPVTDGETDPSRRFLLGG